MTLLLVDDNEDSRFMIGEYLRTLGHDVAEAGSAREALLEVERCSPTVAILDIGLPDMSGHELAGLLLNRLPHLRLIAVTGYTSDVDRRRTAEAGFAKHFAKPVEMKLLAAALVEPTGAS